MTTLIGRLAAACLILAWFFLPSIGHAAACTTSVASLQGWYAMLISGTDAADTTNHYFTGAVLFDGAGNLSGTNIYSGTGNDSGTGNHSGVTGTYVLNTDCSLTLTMTIGAGAPQEFAVGVRSSTNEAVGIEVDPSGIATIDLQAQYSTYTPGLNFTGSSANGTWAANCINFLYSESDLNLATFADGNITGTDAYNDGGGELATANTPYTGNYSVNSDGTIVGNVLILGFPFGFYGVLSNANSEIEYIYTITSGGVTTPYAACTGSLAPTAAPSFSLAAAASVSVAQGNSDTHFISVTATNGFTGTVSFAASGLPAGATAAFSPATSAAGTTLTLSTASGTPTGSYPISITGTSGTLTVTTSVTLTVTAPPGFNLTAAVPALSVVQGKSGSDALSVTATNGFTGSVSFAASGLPTGATAAFSPATSATGTTLTLSTASSTTTGSHVLKITGTSGTTTATTKVTLVITAAGTFSLFPAASNLVVSRASGVSDVITVVAAHGFTGAVSFKCTGLPAGVTGTFSPSSSASNTVFSVAAALSAHPGTYTVTIAGTSAGSDTSNPLTKAIKISLQVR